MTRRRSSRWCACWIVCLACAVVFADAKEAVVMSCAPTPLATVARQAAAIFEATVVAVTVHPRPETLHPDGTVSVGAFGQRATATLTDVTAIRGVPPTTIESVERVLVAGRRYLILAVVYPQRPRLLDRQIRRCGTLRVSRRAAGHLRRDHRRAVFARLRSYPRWR